MNMIAFYDDITIEMLEDCNKTPSYDEYMNDSLVFLTEQNKDICLYGICVGKQEAMLLLFYGEKRFIKCPYKNLYQEMPEIAFRDADADGAEEVIISIRRITGNKTKYILCVCDYVDGSVEVYSAGLPT